MVIQYFELAPVTGQIRAKRMPVRCARKKKNDEKIGASGLLDSAADVLFTDSYSSIMRACYDEASGGDSRNPRDPVVSHVKGAILILISAYRGCGCLGKKSHFET